MVATLNQTTYGNGAQSLAFEPDGTTLLTYGMAIVRWSATTGAMLGSTDFQGGIRYRLMDLSADKSTLVSGDYWATVYDAHDGHVLLTDVGFARTIQGMRLSGDGRHLAVRFAGGETDVYDARTASPPAIVKDGISSAIALGATGDDLVVEGDIIASTALIDHWHVGAGTHTTLSPGMVFGVAAVRLSLDGASSSTAGERRASRASPTLHRWRRSRSPTTTTPGSGRPRRALRSPPRHTSMSRRCRRGR